MCHNTRIHQNKVFAGLSEKTKPKDIFAIYEALGEMQDKLAQDLQMSSQDDLVAAEYLHGPMLRKGTSRFIAGSRAHEN